MKTKSGLLAVVFTLLFSVIGWAAQFGFGQSVINNPETMKQVFNNWLNELPGDLLANGVLLVFKLVVLWYMIYLYLSAKKEAENGVSEAATMASFVKKEAEAVGGKKKYLGDAKNELLADTTSKKMADIGAVSETLRERRKKPNKEDNDAGLRLIASVCQSFHLNQMVQAAEAALIEQRDALSNTYEKYFRAVNFAKGALPLLGFTGTVIGIMIALWMMSLKMSDTMGLPELKPVIASLGVAFDTTLVALVCSFLLRRKEPTWVGKALDSVDDAITAVELDLIPRFHMTLHPKRLREVIENITTAATEKATTSVTNTVLPQATKDATEAALLVYQADLKGKSSGVDAALGKLRPSAPDATQPPLSKDKPGDEG